MLVVDDNTTNLRILRLQLEGWGMKVSAPPTLPARSQWGIAKDFGLPV